MLLSPADQLARCDREIAAMGEQHDAPAWLVALGVGDWERERGLIEAEGDA